MLQRTLLDQFGLLSLDRSPIVGCRIVEDPLRQTMLIVLALLPLTLASQLPEERGGAAQTSLLACGARLGSYAYDYTADALRSTWTFDTPLPGSAHIVQKLKRDEQASLVQADPDPQQSDNQSRVFTVPLQNLAGAVKVKIWMEVDSCPAQYTAVVIDHSVYSRAALVSTLEADAKQLTSTLADAQRQNKALQYALQSDQAERLKLLPKAIVLLGVDLKSDRAVVFHFHTELPGRLKVSAKGPTVVPEQRSRGFLNEHYFRFDGLSQGQTYEFRAVVLDFSENEVSTVSLDASGHSLMRQSLLEQQPAPTYNLLSITPYPQEALVRLKLSRDAYVQLIAAESVELGKPVHVQPIVIGTVTRNELGVAREGTISKAGEQAFKVTGLAPKTNYLLTIKLQDAYGVEGSRVDPDASPTVIMKTPDTPVPFGVADAVNVTFNPLGSTFTWKATRPVSSGEVAVSANGQALVTFPATLDKDKTTLTVHAATTDFLKIMNVKDPPTLTMRMKSEAGEPVEQNLKMRFEIPTRQAILESTVTGELKKSLTVAASGKKMGWQDWLQVGLGLVAKLALP